MALGFDTHVDDRNFEKEGITGEVTRFAKEEISYPSLTIVGTDDNKVQIHKFKVLPNMFASNDDFNTTCTTLSVNIYYKEGDRTIRLGKILPRQVKTFLRLFDDNVVEGMLDENTPLVGDYLYVLCE